MSVETLETLERRITEQFGEEILAGSITERLGQAYPLAQRFQEQALQNSEELFDQSKQLLEALALRRAKLLERFRAGGDWGDTDEAREQLQEMADEMSDQLGEASETYIELLEALRTELEEQNQASLAGTRDWRVFQRFLDEKMDQAQDFAESLIELFDEEIAVISQT